MRLNRRQRHGKKTVRKIDKTLVLSCKNFEADRITKEITSDIKFTRIGDIDEELK